MARAKNGALIQSGIVTVELDGSGDGSATITMTENFEAVPSVWVQEIAADSGTWSVAASSNSLATVTASGSDLTSTKVKLFWIAGEKR